jgi:hypothetical protein
MKYSLRSLMIVITLVCVALGSVGAVIGRVTYLKQRARFQAQQAVTCEQQLLAESYSNSGPLEKSADLTARRLAYHRRLHHEFTLAAERPWIAVDESEPIP